MPGIVLLENIYMWVIYTVHATKLFFEHGQVNEGVLERGRVDLMGIIIRVRKQEHRCCIFCSVNMSHCALVSSHVLLISEIRIVFCWCQPNNQHDRTALPIKIFCFTSQMETKRFFSRSSGMFGSLPVL